MIFVTGGTGFLGRHLVPMLCRENHVLRILTRYPHEHSWLNRYPQVEIIEGDLRNGQGLAAIAGCELLIHAAGLFSMWEAAGDFETTNVTGTRLLLQQAVDAGVKRVVFVSTVAVVGQPQPGQIIDETHPLRPADRYQASKLHAEQVIRQFHDSGQIEAIILRPGAFYGPLGDYGFNRLFFVDAMRGIQMQMDGGDYIIFPAYIRDVAQGILLALAGGRPGESYNICGECLTHREIFEIVRKYAGLHYPPLNIPGGVGIFFARVLTLLSHLTGKEPFYPLSLRSYVFNDWQVSSEKAKTELGFQPTAFAEGARRTIEWYQRGQPNWFAELEC